MKLVIWGVMFLLLTCSAFAATGSVKLLAVLEESDTNSTGILADLTLETTAGHGRVFLDTFPLTKIATQASLRLAKQVACKELDADCSTTDFLYAIRAAPGIVGGPSAGGAAAILAAALVDGRTLDSSVAMTGTINSGGLIGPVGGLREKIEAAAQGGIKTVLIPTGTAEYAAGNVTINLTQFGTELGIRVIEVATLEEALTHFTGKGIAHPDKVFTLDPAYRDTMKTVAIGLCERARQTPLVNAALNLSSLADTYYAQGEYYSAASYCFRAGLAQKTADVPSLTIDAFKNRLASLAKTVSAQDAQLREQPITTLTDLQTYMLIQERLAETEDALIRLASEKTVSLATTTLLIYAEERAYSAKVWSAFFGIGGKTFTLNNETLSNSCTAKINEAEERLDYVQSYYPEGLQESRATLDRAIGRSRAGDFIACLHDAARAKSEADILLSVTGVDSDRIQDIITIKLAAARRSLADAQAQGIFPLIGYAYTEYAAALRVEDPTSALLFSEYANELSGLDVYFDKPALSFTVPWERFGLLGLGVVLGIVVGLLIPQRYRKKR